MSTTLKNGIIIPDNGSRNWGGDLANNWNIIDVYVGYMNDVKSKVTTLENSVAENTANIQTNASNISALQTSKQDVIEDLETIRAGATAGATAVQPSALSNYATKSELLSKAYNSTSTIGNIHVGSVLTGGAKNVAFIVPLNIDGSPTINFEKLVIRCDGNYLFGSTSNSNVTTSYTFTSTVVKGGLIIVLTFSDAETKVPNNSCVVTHVALKLTY